MKRVWWIMALSLIVLAGASTAVAQVGTPAPAFTATDNQGGEYDSASHEGKWTVLEWSNPTCPYVVKHYGSDNMQTLQKEWTAKGVVWLTIYSSGPGESGYVTAEDSVAYANEQQTDPTAVLLDPSGEVGHLYEAKTTPHMFIINPEGVIIYDGAIDDNPAREADVIPTSTNYVSAALTEAMAGKPVTVATSRPYG
jgi:hypothetical protein